MGGQCQDKVSQHLENLFCRLTTIAQRKFQNRV